MGYTVTWIKEEDGQVLNERHFDNLNDAIGEAKKGFNVPFRVRVEVKDDDDIFCYRDYTGRM